MLGKFWAMLEEQPVELTDAVHEDGCDNISLEL